jgi:outer membrane protein TolC
MRVRFLLVLVLATTLIASAQDGSARANVRSLSLRECLDLALGRNLDLQIEHLTAQIAGYNLSSAYGAYVPAFTFAARHDFVSQPGDFDPKKFNPDFPYDMQSDTLGPQLKGVLPYGLSYNFNAFTREDNALSNFSSVTNAETVFLPGGIRRTNNYWSDASVTLQQHLLKDFWIDADRERLIVRRKELKMSQQALQFQLMKTLLAVELSYYDLVAAREYIGVQEKAVELRQQLVRETHRRVELGDLPMLDSEQSESQLQTSLAALTAAQEAMVTQQNNLKSLVTDDFRAWADVELQPAGGMMALPPSLNRSESFQRALKSRPDLLEARAAVERSDVIVKFRRNQLFPNLDLIGGYGGVGVDADPGTSVNHAFSFGNQEYYYGVVLSFPLSNIGERGEYRASRASKQIAELQLRKAEESVLIQIADLINRVESRYSQVGSTRKAREYADAALQAEIKKLQNGFSTSFIVLQLQEILTATRNSEIQALADYNKTQAQLAFAEGTTLERNRVTLETK